MSLWDFNQIFPSKGYKKKKQILFTILTQIDTNNYDCGVLRWNVGLKREWQPIKLNVKLKRINWGARIKILVGVFGTFQMT